MQPVWGVKYKSMEQTDCLITSNLALTPSPIHSCKAGILNNKVYRITTENYKEPLSWWPRASAQLQSQVQTSNWSVTRSNRQTAITFLRSPPEQYSIAKRGTSFTRKFISSGTSQAFTTLGWFSLSKWAERNGTCSKLYEEQKKPNSLSLWRLAEY